MIAIRCICIRCNFGCKSNLNPTLICETSVNLYSQAMLLRSNRLTPSSRATSRRPRNRPAGHQVRLPCSLQPISGIGDTFCILCRCVHQHISVSSRRRTAAAGPPEKEPVTNAAPAKDDDDDDDETCGFCIFMKGGGCKDVFKVGWMQFCSWRLRQPADNACSLPTMRASRSCDPHLGCPLLHRNSAPSTRRSGASAWTQGGIRAGTSQTTAGCRWVLQDLLHCLWELSTGSTMWCTVFSSLARGSQSANVLESSSQTFALRECMLAHREYYAPVLEEEVSPEPSEPVGMYWHYAGHVSLMVSIAHGCAISKPDTQQRCQACLIKPL